MEAPHIQFREGRNQTRSGVPLVGYEPTNNRQETTIGETGELLGIRRHFPGMSRGFSGFVEPLGVAIAWAIGIEASPPCDRGRRGQPMLLSGIAPHSRD